MASEVGICNRALQHLGALRIASLDETSVEARACNNAYEPVRDALLRSHPWSFAIKRASLAADATDPEFDPPGTRYPFPTDALRILLPNSTDCDWTIEDRYILSDWTAPLEVRYVAQITDPNTMDPLFREALAAKLAIEMCEEITQSNTKLAGLLEKYKDIIHDAKRSNAIERPAQDLREDDWLTARL